MNIILIGTVKFTESVLQVLVALEDVVVKGVISMKSSSFNADYVDLEPLCRANDIDLLHTPDVNSDEAISWITERSPEVIFCFGWSRMIKKKVLQICPLGVIGFHPAALPYNRGRHPIIWPLVLGLRETASTFFFMDEGADTGDILSQCKIHIYFEDRALDLYNRITQMALDQIKSFLPKLISGNFDRIPQGKSSGNFWRKRNKDDGCIDFRMSSQGIYNLVRALSKPYVGAHISIGDNNFKVWDSEPATTEMYNIEPGKVLDIAGKKILVKTGDSAIWLTDHEIARKVKIGDYL